MHRIIPLGTTCALAGGVLVLMAADLACADGLTYVGSTCPETPEYVHYFETTSGRRTRSARTARTA